MPTNNFDLKLSLSLKKYIILHTSYYSKLESIHSSYKITGNFTTEPRRILGK